jgi:hypothetical protein
LSNVYSSSLLRCHLWELASRVVVALFNLSIYDSCSVIFFFNFFLVSSSCALSYRFYSSCCRLFFYFSRSAFACYSSETSFIRYNSVRSLLIFSLAISLVNSFSIDSFSKEEERESLNYLEVESSFLCSLFFSSVKVFYFYRRFNRRVRSLSSKVLTRSFFSKINFCFYISELANLSFKDLICYRFEFYLNSIFLIEASLCWTVSSYFSFNSLSWVSASLRLF